MASNSSCPAVSQSINRTSSPSTLPNKQRDQEAPSDSKTPSPFHMCMFTQTHTQTQSAGLSRSTTSKVRGNLLKLSLQEVHAYCFLIVLGEDALAVALDHGRLSHISVADDDRLDRRLELILSHTRHAPWRRALGPCSQDRSAWTKCTLSSPKSRGMPWMNQEKNVVPSLAIKTSLTLF